jgi:hypothetical protein
MPGRAHSAVPFVLSAVLLASCGGTDGGGGSSTGSHEAACGGDAIHPRFPEVVDVAVTREGDTYRFDVTISSPYDSPERYADGWRIMATEGRMLAEHTLLHDHATEQPFTRTQSGVSIPEGIGEVVVEARDLCNGYGGATRTVEVPDASG